MINRNVKDRFSNQKRRSLAPENNVAIPTQKNDETRSQDCEVEESNEINNSVTTNNRDQCLAINRSIFEMTMKFKTLTEVPVAKIKSNQQLKVLDLSHNQI